MSEMPPFIAPPSPPKNVTRVQSNHVNVTIQEGDDQSHLCDPLDDDRGFIVGGEDHHPHFEDDCDTDTETDMNGLKLKPLNHFRWLERDTSIKLNLSGSSSDSVDSLIAWTDWSPRIEIEAVPSGRMFHHTTCAKREEKSGRLIPDQKLFYLLNSRNQRLLAIDYSTDLKSFHVMEPDSQRFIAFFTLPTFPCEEHELPSPIYIHNVIDGEMYVVDPFANDLSIPIKSESGEELAVIMRPPPKWTASQSGLMTLHFTGDDRDGLTCRERAIILGFFLSLGIQGISHWKRSSIGILTVYVLSALLGCFFVLFIYVAFRNDYTPMPLNLPRLHDEDQRLQQQHALMLLRVSPPPVFLRTPPTASHLPTTTPSLPTITSSANITHNSPVSLLMSALVSSSSSSPT